jgi:hypothetical protein
MKFQSDIDIDFGNRDDILQHIKYIPAAMRKVDPIRKHATGVHVTDIPYDAINDMANLDYSLAEERGYFKLDLLNVHVYNQVKDEQHLERLMKEPFWSKLKDRVFVENLIHLNNHFNSIQRMPEPIDSIARLAMFLAIIRPAKKHLIGLPWKEVAKTVWDKDRDGYHFKKSHSIAYANLVVVHMNLLCEDLGQSLYQSN